MVACSLSWPSSASAADAPSPAVTVNSWRIPSPTIPGLHAVEYVPWGAETVSVRFSPGAMFSTSPTMRSPSLPSR